MPQQVSFSTFLTVYESLEALSSTDRDLLLHARQACQRAYAPYSNFYVGAAILLENGQVVTGTNQENAAYPSGICAERTAIFWTGAQYPNEKILAVAIAAHPKGGLFVPISPCGACRQVLSEYENKQESPIRLIMQAENGSFYVIRSVNDLLPLKFSKENLERAKTE
ncbi:MAG: cytidine deaminase [Flammeovirgaceae bacterium]|nr:cytidine deaminase [Flammeovirgaceae bacterium]MDW8286753.1 cytidine deaminase [Flammeovirgaceae bacterium]